MAKRAKKATKKKTAAKPPKAIKQEIQEELVRRVGEIGSKLAGLSGDLEKIIPLMWDGEEVFRKEAKEVADRLFGELQAASRLGDGLARYIRQTFPEE